MPPATAASRTSFTDAPSAGLDLPSAPTSGRRAIARWRSGDVGRTNGGRPAPGPGRVDQRARRLERDRRRAQRLARVADGLQRERGDVERTCAARLASPPAKSANAPGGAAGLQPSASGGGGSGVGSRSSVASSTAARPSTIEWWALPTTPMRPSPSRSAIHSSHIGRSRLSAARHHLVDDLGQVGARRAVHVTVDREVARRPPRRGRRRRAAPRRSAAGSAARAPCDWRCARAAGRSSAAACPRAGRRARPSRRACALLASPPRGTRCPAS